MKIRTQTKELAKLESNSAQRILLVEDDVQAASATARLLTLLGAETLTVYNGEAAVRQFSIFRPSIMIVDIGLPDISGVSVARIVRAHASAVQPYLVAMTGWGIGLNRVKHLVRRSSGEISVESSAGEGTSITFTLAKTT